MAAVLRQRLEKLACGFDLRDNYFAWQAFGRRYGEGPAAPLPPYLQAEHYEAIVARVGRVDLRHANMTEHLAGLPAASRDRYILLDAQDWMTDEQLGELWAQITRTARPGARFRVAHERCARPIDASAAELVAANGEKFVRIFPVIKTVRPKDRHFTPSLFLLTFSELYE